MLTATSLERGVAWGRRERILSASESAEWREGEVASRVRSTRTREQRYAAV